MKKVTAFFLCVCLIFSTCAITSFATEKEDENKYVLISESVEYLEDGSSIVTKVYQEEFPENAMLGSRAVNQTSGIKTTQKKDAIGTLLYTFSVHGTFTYNGAYATATKATYSKVIYKNLYTLGSATTSCNQNFASATGNFYDTLGNFHYTLNPILTCDAYGNLS